MMLRHENPVVTHSIHGVGCSMHRLQSQRRIELIERKYDTDRRLWDERRINKLGCLRSLRSLPFPVLILQISARPLAFVELALTKLLHSLSLSLALYCCASHSTNSSRNCTTQWNELHRRLQSTAWIGKTRTWPGTPEISATARVHTTPLDVSRFKQHLDCGMRLCVLRCVVLLPLAESPFPKNIKI